MTTIDELAAAVATMQDELNTFYLLWAAALVFFMQVHRPDPAPLRRTH